MTAVRVTCTLPSYVGVIYGCTSGAVKVEVHSHNVAVDAEAVWHIAVVLHFDCFNASFFARRCHTTSGAHTAGLG